MWLGWLDMSMSNLYAMPIDPKRPIPYHNYMFAMPDKTSQVCIPYSSTVSLDVENRENYPLTI